MKTLEQITQTGNWVQKVTVRPIAAAEKARWDSLMKAHHYLGFRSLIGKSLRYVATVEDQWVALLGWGSAALHCGVRDRRIGWRMQVKAPRLHLIANNIRFLILPSIRIKNLASKILSLNIKRLSQDWQVYHGHPVVLAETFVDPQRFVGSCYKAAGWEYLGDTQGFRKSAKHYIYHGNPKLTFIKVIDKAGMHWLTSPTLPTHLTGKMMAIKFTQVQLDALVEVLRQLPEQRKPKGIRHSLRSVIGISICAVLSGARSFTAMGEWSGACNQNQLKRFKTFYDRKNKRFVAPSEACIRRTLQTADAKEIDRRLGDWIYSITGEDNSAIAVDGKVLKNAKDADGHQVNLLSAFLHGQGVIVAQTEIDSKTNEIPELKTLLEPLNIQGKVITADALHTQKETAAHLVKKKQTTS